MKELQIIVCVKQVPDPEGPADAFSVDLEAKQVVSTGIAPFLNPFDENALEAALQIKDNHAAKITVVSMGEKLAQPVLRKVLAVGADDLVLLTDSQFKDIDSYSGAYVLLTAIKRIGPYDLILTGRQSSDWGFGITGLYIAEMLQIPAVSLARKVVIEDGSVIVQKASKNGLDVVKAPLPALVTVSNEVGELRYVASVLANRAAAKKPITILNAADLGLEQELKGREIFTLSVFHNEKKCRLIDGGSAEEKGRNLAVIMKEDGVI